MLVHSCGVVVEASAILNLIVVTCGSEEYSVHNVSISSKVGAKILWMVAPSRCDNTFVAQLSLPG